jgi:hypothetical protein
MKIQTPSAYHDSSPMATANQNDMVEATDQESIREGRRQYYYNNVLKQHGIPNPPYTPKQFSPTERAQLATAFKERNKSLKYYIGLIQQKIVT